MIYFIAQANTACAMFFVLAGRLAESLFGSVFYETGDKCPMSGAVFMSHVVVSGMGAANYAIRQVASMCNPPDDSEYMKQGMILNPYSTVVFFPKFL